MATGRLRTSLTLITGAATGFLVALLLQDAPAPEPTQPVGDESLPRREITYPGGEEREVLTLDTILALDGDFAQTAALYNLAAGADGATLEQLIAEADSLASGNDRRGALSILYARYAEIDPAAALRHIQQRRSSYVQAELRALFRAWSKADLAAAVEAAASLAPEMKRAAGTTILIFRDDLPIEAQRDVARRLDMEEMLPQIAMTQSLDEADFDPHAAWQQALGGEEGPLNQSRMTVIVQAWARQDPLAAMDAVMALENPSLRRMLQSQILHEWSTRSPQEAVDWAVSQPPSAERSQLTATALQSLAGEQPRLALEIAEGLSGEERDQAVMHVLSRWAGDDPAGAAASVSSVTSISARRNALGNIAAAYARQDPQGALQWLSSMDVQEVMHATAMMFAVLANQDVAEAGALVTRMPSDQSRQLAVQSVAQIWARQDVEAATQWAESLTDPRLRSTATASLVGQWANFDRDSAVRYVERIPTAPERDAALVSVIQAHHGDLDFAELAFQRLTVPEQRAVAARLLYFKLRETDPERAERYREIAGSQAASGVRR